MNNQTFQTEYNRLNQQQKLAVDTIEGPVMVIAGPGTGKTQILAMRIANILQKTQVNPSNILCLTFTNSGVQAMKQRLLKIIGAASYQIHVHTFHSFCNEIISLFPEKFLTAKKINQLTDLDQIFIIQTILSEGKYKLLKPFKAPFYYQGSVMKSIGDLKQENISPEKFKYLIEHELEKYNQIEDLYHEKGAHKGKVKAKYQQLETSLQRNLELAAIYTKYDEVLQSEGKYDYSDMILFVINAFETDDEILATYQEKYQYILVDEYQDTNSAQNKIVEVLGSFYDEPNVFVVGDDEQSIFRFQGASLENILFFKDTYKSAKTVVLENNYRSTQQILDLSRSAIQNNTNQIFSIMNIPKNLKSQRSDLKGDIEIAEFSHGSVESFFTALKIEEIIKKGTKPDEIAVLYKEHRDAEELIDFLSKLNIPYIIEIGGNVTEDPEIGKIITYLKALNFGVEQTDNHILLEVMHYPFLGISPLDIYKVVIEARKLKKNLFDIISNNTILETLELDEPIAIKEFTKIFLECRHRANSDVFASAFEYIINETGYLNYLLTLNESVHHLNRLQSFFDEIKKINIKNKQMKLSGFLAHLDLLVENNLSIKERELSANYEGVHLMTAHKSKGLEFEFVFIIKCTDRHWGNKTKKELIKLPKSILSRQKSEEIEDPSFETLAQQEEERRLFYVALTRAKKQIFLTFANAYGEAGSASLTVPSKFLSEIDLTLTSKIDVKKYEDLYDERLRLTFAQKKWHPSEKLEDFLRQLILDFKLSPTALNAYLECPQRFFYDNILRVPKTKDFSQSYGTAMHKALELLFRKYKRDFKLPSKNEVIADYETALEEELFSEEGYSRALDQGKDVLTRYYDFYNEEWTKKGIPVSCEYDFSRHNVHFKDIPITGKIDRIDLIEKNSSNVKIIDYKTAKPKSQNHLLGNTKEADTKYLYQAFFYKLLAETDPLFNWKVGEIEFDFIAPDKDMFKKVSLPVDEDSYAKFKNIVEETYDKICNLEFHLDDQACKKSDGKCQYYNICHSNQNER